MSTLGRVVLGVMAAVTAVLALAAVNATRSDASARARIAAVGNPSHNCHPGWVSQMKLTVRAIDRCRAREGLGPLVLPANFHRLSSGQQLFVLVNLARVNRGLPPIVGLSGPLNAVVRRGANAEADPGFPSGHFSAGGSLWAYAYTVMAADDGWMYDDGWARSAVTNTACTSPSASGCWLHREIILMRSRQRLVAGAAVRPIRQRGMPLAHSYAFEILAGYSTTHLVFTWRHELRYFAKRPRLELLKRARHRRG